MYAFHCAIDSALDGLEAVNKMNAGAKYDLVLMDIIMPNLDGVSATHLIRQFDNTPIVAMTSNIRSDDISMYFQHGEFECDLRWFPPKLTACRHERCTPEAFHQRRITQYAGEAPGTSENRRTWHGRTPDERASPASNKFREAQHEKRRLTRQLSSYWQQLELTGQLGWCLARRKRAPGRSIHAGLSPKHRTRALPDASPDDTARHFQHLAGRPNGCPTSATARSTTATQARHIRHFRRRGRGRRRCEAAANVPAGTPDGSAYASALAAGARTIMRATHKAHAAWMSGIL